MFLLKTVIYYYSTVQDTKVCGVLYFWNYNLSDIKYEESYEEI